MTDLQYHEMTVEQLLKNRELLERQIEFVNHELGRRVFAGDEEANKLVKIKVYARNKKVGV